MVKGIKYLFNLLMVVTLLVSTTGITIYTHYCNAEGEVISSLFSDEATCDHHGVTLHQHDCCQTKSGCSTDTQRDCCSDVSQVFKINNTYYTSLLENDSPQPVEIELFNVPSFSLYRFTEPVEVNTYPQEPPSPLAGKKLLTRLLQIRIAPDPLS